MWASPPTDGLSRVRSVKRRGAVTPPYGRPIESPCVIRASGCGHPPLRKVYRGWVRTSSLPPSTLRVATSLTEGGFERPPRRGRQGFSAPAGAGMTPLRGVRGDVGIAPYGRSIEVRSYIGRREGQSPSPTDEQQGCGRGMAGRCTPRVLVPLRSTAWASPPTEGLSRVGSFNIQKEAPGGRFLLHILLRIYWCIPLIATGSRAGRCRRRGRRWVGRR